MTRRPSPAKKPKAARRFTRAMRARVSAALDEQQQNRAATITLPTLRFLAPLVDDKSKR